MKQSYSPVAALFAIVFTSCATPYQEVGTDRTGGYSFARVAPTEFKVCFAGNGFTQPKRAKDFATLRAAEITLAHNFRYFTILDVVDLSSSADVDFGGRSHTIGTVSPHGFSATTTHQPNTVPIHMPGIGIRIKCFTTRPGGHAGEVLDASAVRDEIRAKWKLDAS
jgi:hypothetical protein